MEQYPSKVTIPINRLEMKRVQRTLGLTNVGMSKLLGVSLPTYNTWLAKNNVPLAMCYSIDNLLRLSDREVIRVKMERKVSEY